MKARFLLIILGGVLALGLAGCESMGMKRSGSSGASSGSGTTTSGSGGYQDNGAASGNSDASGWGSASMPSGQTTE